MSKTAIQSLNFLSIGDRGVGKTIFLLANYAALRPKSADAQKQDIYFDCQNGKDRKNLESLLALVAKTGQYPPPTLQITDFRFDVKRHSWQGAKVLCQFHWSDVPGESCQSFDAEFQAVLQKSHGCCLFLDAYELIHNPQYLAHLEMLTKRAEAIASLAHRYQLHYSIALVLTKCDLIGAGPSGLLKLEEKLHPLIRSLKAVNANYRCFYSAIPISAFKTPTVLEAHGIEAPLLWLVTEARASSRPLQTLDKSLDSVLSNSVAPSSKTTSTKSGSPVWLRLLAGVGILGVLTGLFVGLRALLPSTDPSLSSNPSIRRHQITLKRDPDNVEATRQLAAEYTKLEQYGQAIPLLENLAQEQPENLNLLTELGRLYLVTGQLQKEENIYDQILLQDESNILALTGKAEIYLKKGEIETAKSLFAEAEERAPSEKLKQTIRKIATENLQAAEK
ncbi:hypothetical protein C1752_02891 [Acaryochloris thomasi RCC1774]|uniref:Uncharacterized protein n=1 Tax=Acaryochloris thomasi RCC1774 TaxID=1764569 RepID=A0A2W1JX98_9CYAN|nr:tetratricopeptide repeat protein [Acaryochloris thomasi]PZD72967.1 hypothetical protein C1752_02891 [Acaryochloris thomasi RCC1774]